MDFWKDIILDAEGDLAISSDGDLVIDYSFNQEAALIANLIPGNWKSDPVIGAAISDLINDNSTIAEVHAHLRRHYARDGKVLDSVDNNLMLKFK